MDEEAEAHSNIVTAQGHTGNKGPGHSLSRGPASEPEHPPYASILCPPLPSPPRPRTSCWTPRPTSRSLTLASATSSRWAQSWIHSAGAPRTPPPSSSRARSMTGRRWTSGAWASSCTPSSAAPCPLMGTTSRCWAWLAGGLVPHMCPLQRGGAGPRSCGEMEVRQDPGPHGLCCWGSGHGLRSWQAGQGSDRSSLNTCLWPTIDGSGQAVPDFADFA